LHLLQGVGKTSFWFRNSVGSFHPMNFAVDPRLYNPPANVTVTKNKISYNPATASPTSTVDFTPAVVHVHGAVVSSEFDGVPYFTLTKTGDKTLHKFWDITNPAALALYHDHAWGFTRLTV
jgi:FtsP/CotA-like multicopper oxidase with cupredoxin domain